MCHTGDGRCAGGIGVVQADFVDQSGKDSRAERTVDEGHAKPAAADDSQSDGMHVVILPVA
ncbi:hypothetical protein GCM10009784_01810 [Arthrobacter parietis]|uniref:Uncharacterized protein n=1 Tax=Arthrobacter parietis TaxID=271434 RepID=A0ABN3AM58_9MICC